MGRSKDATRYLLAVKSLPCVICEKMGTSQNEPTEAHHAFDTTTRSDYLVAALCVDHHRGGNGFHSLGQREWERRYKITEAQAVGLTAEGVWNSTIR